MDHAAKGNHPLKIKCRPDDFVVEELPTVEPGDAGPFTFYRLEKVGLGTPEAIHAIRARWNLADDQVHHAGLKDRHALTIQFLSIARGPWNVLEQDAFRLEPIGRLHRPYGPAGSRGNRFTIIVRDLHPDQSNGLRSALSTLESDGVPNYFDDQRFGSVTTDGRFIAAEWLRGNHEEALRLAIAAPNPHDRPGDRAEKSILREHWNDWPAAKAALDRSHARSLVTYLVDHPSDHRGAYARLRRDLRSIQFSAYQSELWNRLLARMIERQTRPDQRIAHPFRTGPLPLPFQLDAEQARVLHNLELPLPSARNPFPTGEVGEATTEVLAAEGIEWSELRVRHLKDLYLSKGTRAAMVVVRRVEFDEGEDTVYPRSRAVRLAFELPRGAYATMILKRLNLGAESES